MGGAVAMGRLLPNTVHHLPTVSHQPMILMLTMGHLQLMVNHLQHTVRLRNTVRRRNMAPTAQRLLSMAATERVLHHIEQAFSLAQQIRASSCTAGVDCLQLELS